MDDKYLYEVRPVKPIVIPEGRSIKRPSSLLLSKEEVKEVMKKARVYRKFPDNINPVPVTGENLDELHKENFLDETPATHTEPDSVVDEPKAEEPEVLIIDGNVDGEETTVLKDNTLEEPEVEAPVEENLPIEASEPETAEDATVYVETVPVVEEEKHEETIENIQEELAPILDAAEEVAKSQNEVEEVAEETEESSDEEVVEEEEVILPPEEAEVTVEEVIPEEETPEEEEVKEEQTDATESNTTEEVVVEQTVAENTVTEDETVEPTVTEDANVEEQPKTHGFHEKNNIQFNITK